MALIVGPTSARELPLAVYSVAAALKAVEGGTAAPGPCPARWSLRRPARG